MGKMPPAVRHADERRKVRIAFKQCTEKAEKEGLSTAQCYSPTFYDALCKGKSSCLRQVERVIEQEKSRTEAATPQNK